MNRRGTAVVVIVAVMLVGAGAFAQQDALPNVQVSINNNPVTFTEPVLMVDMQYPLLPAETFLTALGATSRWDAGAQQLTVELDDAELLLWLDRGWVTVNGMRQEVAGGLQTLNQVRYVRGPEIARFLGLEVQWDPADLTLAISREVMMPEGPTVAATLLEVLEADSLVVRVNETAKLEEIPVADEVVIQRSAAEETPAPATQADLQPGDLVQIVLDETATAVGITASYSQILGTIASIEANRLTLQGGQSYPLGEGVEAIGSNGVPLHLLAAVGQGAILTLNPETDAVWRILAQRRGATTPPRTAAPVIAAFIIPRYDGPLGEGDPLEIRIIGSAGASASVQLGAAGQVVNVLEDRPGVYAGTMNISTDLLIPDEYLVAELEAAGATSARAQSNRPVMVDAQPPVFEQPMPQHGSTIADVNTHIRINFHDGQGVGVDPTTATLSADGIDVTKQAQVEPDSIFYDTPRQLGPGRHTAAASIADELGNVATYTWNWTIGVAGRGIVGISHDAEAALSPGDTITVTIEVAERGQTASFSIQGVAREIPMARVAQTNVYQGSYTVQQGDAAVEATVTADFTADDGAVYQANAATSVTIAAPDVAFAITTPAEGATTGRRIRPAGTAPPGSSVRWTVSYQEFILAGDINSGTAVADTAGNWKATQEIDLKLLLIGMADAYTLKAELLDGAGAVQETQTVRFKADD